MEKNRSSVPLGFHASHEQFPPSELLAAVRHAETAGFQHAMCSDHFMPFSEEQGHSGYAWSWLGAALQATRLTFGVVTAPGQRYHPAITAQAAATLAEMFPGRFWMALGSGENLNEHITGDAWPPKVTRQARLLECVEIIRALFAGETVSRRGLVRVQDAKLYTRPATPPPLIGAAVSAASARWVGGWADGLVTVNQPEDELRRVIDAFREGGGEGKPMYLQAHLSLEATEQLAEAAAHRAWRNGALTGELVWDVALPAHLDAAAKFVRPEDVRHSVRVSASLEQHLTWLRGYAALGFDRIYIHQVGPGQQPFASAFGPHAAGL